MIKFHDYSTWLKMSRISLQNHTYIRFFFFVIVFFFFFYIFAAYILLVAILNRTIIPITPGPDEGRMEDPDVLRFT